MSVGGECSLDYLEQAIMDLDADFEHGLLAKLYAAEAMIERDKIIPATNQLQALINQLEAKRDNPFPGDVVDELVGCILEVIAGL